MKTECVLVFISLLLVVSTTYAEVIPWRSCSVPAPNVPSDCTIHEVRLDPCKEVVQSKPCKIKRGTNARVSFDYTTNFTSETLGVGFAWANEILDIPFLGMDSDACKYTTCPVISGTKQTYTYELPILRSFPVRSYNVKIKLWEENRKQECCLIIAIKLVNE